MPTDIQSTGTYQSMRGVTVTGQRTTTNYCLMKMCTGNAKLCTSYLMQGLQADMSCVTEAMQCGNVCSVQSIAHTDSGQIKITS